MEIHPKVRNPNVPLRNWRVVLDKIAVILVLVAVQDATETWCLEWGLPRSALSSADIMEDYYAEAIQLAR